MDEITQTVGNLGKAEREYYEALVGHPLTDDQQVHVRVVTPAVGSRDAAAAAQTSTLPEWCNVYAGLTDDEIESVESVVLERANLERAGQS